MLQKIKNNFIKIMALSLLTTVGMTGVAVAQPDPQQALCTGAAELQIDTSPDAGACTADSEATEDGVNSLITNIINIFSVIVGIIAVIMIIIGGLKYITSGGDSGNVTGAKNTILYAIIGLIIVALAQFIVRFILSTTVETAG